MTIIEPFVLEKSPRIFGIIERPNSDGIFQVVVMLHGFSGDHITSGFKFPKLSRKLAEKGITAVRFDFRGSGDSEGDFLDTTLLSEVQDAWEVLDFLRKKPWCGDISLVGYSLGGAVAALLAVRRGDIRKVCLWCPALLNKKLFSSLQTEYESDFQRDGYVDTGEVLVSSAFKDEILSIDVAEEFKGFHGPVRIIHGSSDTTVPYEDVKRFAEENGFDFQTVHGADHRFSQFKNKEKLLKLTVDFFTQIQ